MVKVAESDWEEGISTKFSGPLEELDGDPEATDAYVRTFCFEKLNITLPEKGFAALAEVELNVGQLTAIVSAENDGLITSEMLNLPGFPEYLKAGFNGTHAEFLLNGLLELQN